MFEALALQRTRLFRFSSNVRLEFKLIPHRMFHTHRAPIKVFY
jgi:hypothetical protein